MPTAYAPVPCPKDLSTMATLVHRLRHPLRIHKARHNEFRPSHSPSVRDFSDKRRPKAENEWLEGPVRSDSPVELVQIEDKGEYSQPRYGDLDLFWNSIMIEATEEERAKRKKEDERKKRRRGCVFEDNEKIYTAFNNHQPIQSGMKKTGSIVVTEPTSSLSNYLSAHPISSGHADMLPDRTIYSDHDASGDRYITLTENTSVAELDSHQTTISYLTWNSAFNKILASSCVPSGMEATIRARARDRTRNKIDGDVDMRDVGMVPNFSYPIASARWCERHDINAFPSMDSDKQEDLDLNTSWGNQCHQLVGLGISLYIDRPSSTTTKRCPPASSNSLYRPLTHRTSTRSDPYLVLRDILEPSELDMYQEIVTHDPRFTVLLNDADVLSRQVPLVQKLHRTLSALLDQSADLEDLYTDLCKRTEMLKKMVNFGNKVMEGCWKRECLLLNTLLAIQQRRSAPYGFAARFLRRKNGGTVIAESPTTNSMFRERDRQSLCWFACSIGSGTVSGSEMLLKQGELDVLIAIAAQNVKVLKDDVQDSVNLVRVSTKWKSRTGRQ